MATYRFDLTKDGQQTIQISADSSSPNKWSDLTSPSILTFGVGVCDVEDDHTDFNSVGAGTVFTLSGIPFGASVGDTGDTTLDYIPDGIDGTSWTWTLKSIN